MAKEGTVGSRINQLLRHQELGGESVSFDLLGSRLAVAEVYANESVNKYWTSLMNQNVTDFMCDSETLASRRVLRVNADYQGILIPQEHSRYFAIESLICNLRSE